LIVMHWMMLLGFMLVTVLNPVSGGAENSMIVGGQLMPLGPVDLTHSSAPNSRTAGQAPTLAPGLDKPQTIFRDVPSVSGAYSVAGTTLRPYVGAGFANGYSTDLDRSLNIAPASSTDPGLRGMFGQHMAPSEFQLGVRIPF
jgi:hypothetical protein